MKKNLIILVFGFDEFQINFVTVRPGKSNYDISYMSEFAYKFESPSDAARAIDFLRSSYVGLRYEIIEVNCLNFM